MKKTFTKQYLTEDLDLPGSDLQVSDEIVEHSRWSVIHKIVFKDGGKFWMPI